MKLVSLRILGECAIQVGEARVAPSAPHLFALLLYLSVERGRDVPRSALFDLLFPGESSSAAAHNLRQLVYRLKKLGVEVESSAATVRLCSGHVEDLIQRRLDLPYHESSRDPASSCTLLPGYDPPTAPFSKWLESYRESVHRALVRKLSEELQTARRGANWAIVEAFARTLLTLDAFNETATLCLAESLARTGSKQRAVSLLQQFEQEVGSPTSGLALPSRLLKRRISESTLGNGPESAEAPLVGRTREMEMLADAWAEARSGRCTVVSVTGEKSIGKSRLAAEFLSLVALDGTGSVVFSRRRPADVERPLSLFADICKQLIGMPGAAGCAPSGLAYLSKLTEAPNAIETLRSDQSEGQFVLGTLRNAIAELIACVADERPLILVIDDARFLDHASRESLLDTFQRAQRSPLLTLLVGDAERSLSADARHLRLQALEITALNQVAEHVVGRHQWPIDDQLRAWCLEMATGNPGYLELLLQSARSARERQLPPDLIALVGTRISALTPHARRALQALALLGAPCDGESLERLCGLKQAELLDALEELDASSMIGGGQDGVTCRSVLIEECTRASTAASVSAVLHARAARLLERHSRGHSLTQATAWRIAAHWKGARHLANQRHWERVCWRQSIAIGQPMLAVGAIRTALADVSSLAERAELLEDLASALLAALRVSELGGVLRERASLSDQLCDGPSTRVRLEFDAIEASSLLHGDPRLPRERLRELLRSDHLDVRRRIRAARTLLLAADAELNVSLAREAYEANSAISPPDDASALLHKQTSLIFNTIFGDRDEAKSNILSLLLLTRSMQPCWQSLLARTNIALAQQIVDSAPIDFGELERTYLESCTAHMHGLALATAGRIGCLYIDNGDIANARRWVERAEPLLKLPGAESVSPDFLSCSANLALLDGDYASARALVRAMPLHPTRSGTDNLRNSLMVHRLRIEQLAGGAPAHESDLAALLEWHGFARSHARHDDHMEVLWVALASGGRHSEASSLLFEYLTQSRRERRSCAHFLSTRTAADPVWSQVWFVPNRGYELR